MATKTRPSLTNDDLHRVKSALDCIEQAQTLINMAAEQLCPVPGFGREWSAAGKVYDQIKRYWHRIASRRTALLPPYTVDQLRRDIGIFGRATNQEDR